MNIEETQSQKFVLDVDDVLELLRKAGHTIQEGEAKLYAPYAQTRGAGQQMVVVTITKQETK